MNWKAIIVSFCLLIAATSLASAQVASAKSAASTLPAGVRAEEVTFSGPNVKLAGTLLLPKLEAGKRAPAVLIIVDAGATPRDGVPVGEAMHYTYRDLAAHLAANGIASLRYDKRCVGASECQKNSSFDDHADDARGALALLRARADIDPARIALCGHGEGGTMASVIAAADTKLAALVMVAAPGRNLGKLMRERIQNRLKEAGKPEAESAAFIAKLDRVVRGLTTGSPQDFADEKLKADDPYDALLLGLIKQPDFVIPLLINDPLQVVNNVTAPILILQGEKDMQVAVKDARYIEEALKRAEHKDTTLHLLPDADHWLKINKSAPSFAADADTARPLDPMLPAILTAWLQKRLK